MGFKKIIIIIKIITELTVVSSSCRTWSYSLIATQNMIAVTSSKQWIHFLRSDLWPPTSNNLKQSHAFRRKTHLFTIHSSAWIYTKDDTIWGDGKFKAVKDFQPPSTSNFKTFKALLCFQGLFQVLEKWTLFSRIFKELWHTTQLPSVLWRCWLGGRKGIRPVKKTLSGGVLA